MTVHQNKVRDSRHLQVKRVCRMTTSLRCSNIADRSRAALMSWKAFMPARYSLLSPPPALVGLSTWTQTQTALRPLATAASLIGLRTQEAG